MAYEPYKFYWWHWCMTRPEGKKQIRWPEGDDTVNGVNFWHTWQANLFDNEEPE